MALRDLLGNQLSEEIVNELNYIYQQIHILGWRDLRPWDEFCFVFKIPQANFRHLEQRITTNFLHYRSNYLAICGVIFLLRILLAPYVVLTLIMIGAIWVYGLLIIKKPIVIGEYSIDSNTKRIICSVTSFTLLTISGSLEIIIWSCLYCILLCCLHMIFRPRNVTSKVNKVNEELKLSGFNWLGSNSSASNEISHTMGDEDPENPSVFVENHTPGLTSAYVRKRNSPVGEQK